MSGGWWWPGFLIELTIFLFLVLGMTWWLMNWTIRLMEKRDEEKHEHDT